VDAVILKINRKGVMYFTGKLFIRFIVLGKRQGLILRGGFCLGRDKYRGEGNIRAYKVKNGL